MKNPEHEKSKQESGDETGFSEKELDLDIEIRAGEWQNLKKFKRFQLRTRQGKIIATYQAVSNRLNQLVALYYKFVGNNPKDAAKMLSELRKLRSMQEFLLNCLIWSREAGSRSAGEPKGKLTKDLVPEEIWEIIE